MPSAPPGIPPPRKPPTTAPAIGRTDDRHAGCSTGCAGGGVHGSGRAFCLASMAWAITSSSVMVRLPLVAGRFSSIILFGAASVLLACLTVLLLWMVVPAAPVVPLRPRRVHAEA